MKLTQVKSYNCGTCGKRFRQEFQLTVHKASFPDGGCERWTEAMRPRPNRAARRSVPRR
ncbi:hypothetical protein [Mycobacteroides abscessus]|uniref:hypothetical protein n=1 Tax=Mycobacteroides abscessus TaxID=36809 RepID=UPI0012AAC5F5|nr:hypothetical protein [Mycobacteroides abscessus]